MDPGEVSENGDGICAAFYEAALAAGRVHGTPLPPRILKVGDTSGNSAGWSFKLNSSGDELERTPGYTVAAFWGGFPAGFFNAAGGMIAAGSAANEKSFIEWCKGVEGEHELPPELRE